MHQLSETSLQDPRAMRCQPGQHRSMLQLWWVNDTCLELLLFWERPYWAALSRDLSSEEFPFSAGADDAAFPTLAEDRVLTIVDERPSHVN